jgi:hypothetical protein
MGDPHGGEWTVGDSAAGRGDGAGEASPAGFQNQPPEERLSTDGSHGNEVPSEPPISWQIVSHDGPASGTVSPPPARAGEDATASANSSSSEAGGDPTFIPVSAAGAGPTGEPPSGPGASGESSSPEATGGQRPPLEWTIKIPDQEPPTEQLRNSVIRSVATWLGRAAASLGPLFLLDPRVRAAFAALRAAAWIYRYFPRIASYLDNAKTLEELQSAVDEGADGYEIHHIVEVQKNSVSSQANWLRFRDRINSRENLLRVPYWKHVEISSWYSRANRDFGGLSPRDYLRGKSWEDQYNVGIDVLRKFGVLK